ncbi:mechanosensitive ion channel [Aliikangiella marina]|uniref:Mechanosensitive ion channel n=1 Tax=Aliikangiella marina TaxID=1712262 RepID=A0A545TJ38_9GAMM|nr:mechanosensitive ion channel domain-containing protein [Aliikangiella marina]TQV77217.1 mechanosensitive ion channel [Aliikangiella marina]
MSSRHKSNNPIATIFCLWLCFCSGMLIEASAVTPKSSLTQLLPSSETKVQNSDFSDSAVINFETINNQWWKQWSELNSDQKQFWINQIEQSYDAQISQMPLSNKANEHVRETRGLIRALRKIVLFENQAIKIDKHNEYTLKEWASYYDIYRSLSDTEKRLQAEIKQRKEGIEAIKQDIQALAVKNRNFTAYSNQSIEIVLNIYGSQLSLIYSQEKQTVANLQLAEIQSALKITALRLTSSSTQLVSNNRYDRQLQEQQKALNEQLDRIQNLMNSLQRQAWSSVTGDQEVVYQLSFHEEKLKSMSIRSELLAIDILLNISRLIRQEPEQENPNWHNQLKEYNQEYDRLMSQFYAYRERVIASGEAANEMIFERTQRPVWEYLESNQKLANEFKVELEKAEFYANAYRQFLAIEKGWTSEFNLDWQIFKEEAQTGWAAVVNYTLFSVNEYPVTLGNVLNALFIIIIAIFISKIIKRILSRVGRKRAISESTLFNVARVIHYLIITIAIIVALSILGIDSSKIALVAGALSVGIGFGLQAIFNNFVSGLILLFERPLKVGDLVELESGVRGRIKAINVRSTQLKTRDNIDLLVPNSEFVNFKVINYTFSDPLRRIHVPFRAALNCDKARVKEIVVEAAYKLNFTQKDKQHEPDVWLKRIGEFSLEFELIVWVNANKLHDNDGVESHYLWEVDSALKAANIHVPIPMQSIAIERGKSKKT